MCGSGSFSSNELCTSSYSPERHGVLFNRLRGLMHRVYKKGVVRGLLKHLNVKYYHGRRDLIISVKIARRDNVVTRQVKVSAWT